MAILNCIGKTTNDQKFQLDGKPMDNLILYIFKDWIRRGSVMDRPVENTDLEWPKSLEGCGFMWVQIIILSFIHQDPFKINYKKNHRVNPMIEYMVESSIDSLFREMKLINMGKKAILPLSLIRCNQSIINSAWKYSYQRIEHGSPDFRDDRRY